MNKNFIFYLSQTNSLRELYLMLRTFPRFYKFKCDCGKVHTISSLNMYAECSECGYGDKLYHKAGGDEIHDVIFLVLKWLGIPDEKHLELGLHLEDVEKKSNGRSSTNDSRSALKKSKPSEKKTSTRVKISRLSFSSVRTEA